MAVCKSMEVVYQNQMQFNLDVPLAASNIASHYHRPCPIMVERVGGRNTIPGKHQGQQSAAPRDSNVSASSSFNYTTLSEDTMAKVSQLARRDLKNKRLQMQREGEKSPSADYVVVNHRPASKVCTRQRRSVNKPRSPLRARESEKNRRIGNIQTPPPPRRARSAIVSGIDDTLQYVTGTGEGNKPIESFFPAKPATVQGGSCNQAASKDEVGKLQQELETYLQTLCRNQKQVLREGSAEFLQHRIKGKVKNNYLAEEEDYDRVRARAGEINTRSSRNLYNLSQKVKQLQRDVSQSDLRNPTKKSQISTQLIAAYRGAVRALQVFVNQLPYQDLQMGLPSTYSELALLLRQLTTLMTLTQHGATEEGGDAMLKLLDQVDVLNSKWCSMALQWNRDSHTRHRKAWVSDTKVDTDLLYNNPPGLIIAKKLVAKSKAAGQKNRAPVKQQQTRSKNSKGVGIKSGKENKQIVHREDIKSNVNKPSLAGQKTFGFVSVDSKPVQSSNAVFKDIDSSKGYMLPPELMAKRERAQRAVELSNKNFADSTHSSRSKFAAAPMPSRPSSAPSPSRKKEVNFDLREDKRSYLPWIPAGCAPCKPRARSSSGERSPFYVRSLDDTEEWDSMSMSERPTKSVSLRNHPREPAAYGYISLPTDRQMRSCDVSDSFVDLIEKRLLYRMLHGKANSRERRSRKDQMYSSDEALDITDLTVERSHDTSSLNTTAEAASMVDAPTLENIKLKIEEMERTKREIRQRWSSVKFVDTHRRRVTHLNDCPVSPAVIDYNKKTFVSENRDTNRYDSAVDPINKAWSEEPLLFTKERTKRTATNPNLHYRTSQAGSKRSKVKQQVSLDQDTLDRILEDRDRLAYQQRKHSHHPAGKFDPWTLMEQISEEILNECFQEVAGEVEKVSEEMANQMYKSEFMVTGRPSESEILEQEGYDGLAPQRDEHYEAAFTVNGDAVFEGDERLGYLVDDYGTGREFLMDEETPRSQISDGGRFDVPPPGIAAEPLLDNVSQLVQEKVGSLVESGNEEERSGGGDEEDDEETSSEEEDDDDSDDENDNDDDDGNQDYDDEYSDDNFEKVSDVEL